MAYIDRKSVVRRHTVEVAAPDPASALTVGNGDFAYTCDITGMQSFAAYHDQTTAMAEQRLAVATATMTTWGWHTMPNPEGFTLADTMTEHDTPRGPVSYPDDFGLEAMMGGQKAEEYRAGAWLNANPQRLDLGRIGLQLRPTDETEPETTPTALQGTHQCLDLWTGTISSLFTYTAAFMASFVEERNSVHHLPAAPLVPAQEFYDPSTTEDPTFELAYWWWGLEIAQQWRERTGRPRDEQWQQIQDTLAVPHQSEGRYTAIATDPYLRRDDHPALLCAPGVVPDTPLIDPAVMAATLQDVQANWDWGSAWGWDFPVMAMTCTRLRRPDLAVDALLMDTGKNHYQPTRHCPQIGSLLPLYLPANGALLTAVSLMIAGWDGHSSCPGFPDDGTWKVRHEGFLPWPGAIPEPRQPNSNTAMKTAS